jgi:H2-forming N5,N10-methylenetetrahydromethanopterin dehydrogenase-like enzyme
MLFTAFPWADIIDLIVSLVEERSKLGLPCLTEKLELLKGREIRLRSERLAIGNSEAALYNN